MKSLTAALTSLSLFVVATAASAQTSDLGAAVFARSCAMCHSNEAGTPNRMGPNLSGVGGRKAGTLAGFRYSPAMAKSGLTWDKATLDRFLTKPSAVVPGNRMGFGGVPAAVDRSALIGYLLPSK